LSGRWMDTDRQADGVDSGMQFGRQATAGPADRGSLSPPLWMARP
jgi:hypothetical protein